MKTFRLFFIALSLLFTQLIFGVSLHPHHQFSPDSVKVIEKVYLHVDRDSYHEGDDIWFKAYLIDAVDHLLTDHSNNLHVELISPSSKIISSQVIRIEDGLGNGDFKLPDDIKSGRYKVRAYTNYMRNFSDQLFFNKEIIVFNSTDTAKGSERVKYLENQIRLSFFPEGGSLVDNVSSIVAFKAENSIGKSCDISGKIFSSKGELITAFKSTHLGMGSFFLRPAPGLSYYSVYRGADSIDFRTSLPTCFPVGVTFSVSINRNNELLLTTKTNTQTLPVISDHELLLSFSVRKEVFKSIPFKINSPITSFVVPIDDLPEGILMLTLSATKDLPLAERLVYNEWEVPAKIQIETDKPLYSKREPVSVKLFLPGDSTIEKNASVSLAVVGKNFIEDNSMYPRTISSWFLLESDVRGYIEDPSYYFNPSNPDRLRDLDLLLRTQGWRDFDWKYNKSIFLPENGFSVSGRLRKYYLNKAIEGSRISIGIFGSKSTFVSTIPVDTLGRFNLSGIDLKGEARLVVTGIGKKERLRGFLLLDSVTYIPAKVSDSMPVVSILSNTNEQKLKSYYEIYEGIRKKYKLSDTIPLGGVNIISQRPKDAQTLKIERSRSKYGRPESELVITQDMYSYANLAEAMRGKIPGVEVTNSYALTNTSGMDQMYKIRIRGTGSLNGSIDPLVLVDGIPSTIEDLVMIPVNFIDRIDVLKSVGSSAIFGMKAANGVINLITRAGGPGYVPVNYSKNIRISGYNASRIFYSPTHLADSSSEYNPDLRSTLLWKPDIDLEGSKWKTIKYYNGDNTSFVRIIAEGMTSTGIPVTGEAEYEVR